jgi:hypothetical protein
MEGLIGADPRRRGRAPRWRNAGFGLVVALVSSATALGGTAGAATTPSTASGTIAALVGAASMEVQNPTSGQVTVSWTGATSFTQTLVVPSSDLGVGDCVTATTGNSSAKSTSKHFTATTVSITRPSSTGSCARGGGFGGLPGGGPAGNGGFGRFRPPGGTFPRGNFPRGSFPRGAAARFSAAFGTVTSISGSTFVVKGVVPVVPPKSSSTKKPSSSSTKPKTTTQTSTVTFTSKTVFTKSAPATSAAIAVGQCATAFGSADQTGAITANAISIRAPTSGQCVAAFGGFGGGFGRRFGGRGGS